MVLAFSGSSFDIVALGSIEGVDGILGVTDTELIADVDPLTKGTPT